MNVGMGIMYMLGILLVIAAGLVFLICLDISPGWTIVISLLGVILFAAFMVGASQ